MLKYVIKKMEEISPDSIFSIKEKKQTRIFRDVVIDYYDSGHYRFELAKSLYIINEIYKNEKEKDILLTNLFNKKCPILVGKIKWDLIYSYLYKIEKQSEDDKLLKSYISNENYIAFCYKFYSEGKYLKMNIFELIINITPYLDFEKKREILLLKRDRKNLRKEVFSHLIYLENYLNLDYNELHKYYLLLS